MNFKLVLTVLCKFATYLIHYSSVAVTTSASTVSIDATVSAIAQEVKMKMLVLPDSLSAMLDTISVSMTTNVTHLVSSATEK